MTRRSHRTPLALAALVAVVPALAACGGGGAASESGSGGSSEGSGEGTTVATMFGDVEVPAPSEDLRVVALGWSDAEISLALGVEPVATYDWLSFGEENNGTGPWAQELWSDDAEPTVIPRTDGAVDYELVQSMEPDLILNVNSAGDEAEHDRLAEIAPTVYAPEGTESFAVGWRNQTTQVAEALGQAERGEELVAETEQTIADAAEANPVFDGLNGVTGSKFGDAYGANLPGDFRWDLMADLGFTLNPPVEELPAQGFYADVSAEQVEVFDADVALLFPIGYTIDELTSDPLIASLPVVQEDRTVFIEDGDLSNAFSAGNVLSIPVVVDELVPQLAEAAANVQ